MARTYHFRIVLPTDTVTVLADMLEPVISAKSPKDWGSFRADRRWFQAHHNTAEQKRANIWRAALIRIVTALSREPVPDHAGRCHHTGRDAGRPNLQGRLHPGSVRHSFCQRGRRHHSENDLRE